MLTVLEKAFRRHKRRATLCGVRGCASIAAMRWWGTNETCTGGSGQLNMRCPLT